MPARESSHKTFLVKVPIRKSLSEKFEQDFLDENGLIEADKKFLVKGVFIGAGIKK